MEKCDCVGKAHGMFQISIYNWKNAHINTSIRMLLRFESITPWAKIFNLIEKR